MSHPVLLLPGEEPDWNRPVPGEEPGQFSTGKVADPATRPINFEKYMFMGICADPKKNIFIRVQRRGLLCVTSYAPSPLAVWAIYGYKHIKTTCEGHRYMYKKYRYDVDVFV